MGYLSYGHEFVLSLILLLVISYVILDLIPLLYRRLCDAFASAPINMAGRFILIISACFLL
ncbi:MAG TPA: hypothetical protein DCZ75_00155 [Geobacter sp.]|nr:hypothetical protein [Geobacter sp.]